MNNSSLIERVAKLAKFFEEAGKDPDHKIILQKASTKPSSAISDQAYLPEDLSLLLSEIGEMRRWGYNDCTMIHWWRPMSIEESQLLDLIFYEFSSAVIERGNSLLAFAYDCDAVVYLLDTTCAPYSIVCTDGLDAWSAMKNVSAPDFVPVNTWALKGDFLSTIEGWAGFHR